LLEWVWKVGEMIRTGDIKSRLLLEKPAPLIFSLLISHMGLKHVFLKGQQVTFSSPARPKELHKD
jgi:hypothetical protein